MDYYEYCTIFVLKIINRKKCKILTKKWYKYNSGKNLFFFLRRTVAIVWCRGTCNSPCCTMESWIDIWTRVYYKTHFRGAYLYGLLCFISVLLLSSLCKATNSLQAFHVFLKFKEEKITLRILKDILPSDK